MELKVGSRPFGRDSETNFQWRVSRQFRAWDDSCFAVVWTFADNLERYDPELAAKGAAWNAPDGVDASSLVSRGTMNNSESSAFVEAASARRDV